MLFPFAIYSIFIVVSKERYSFYSLIYIISCPGAPSQPFLYYYPCLYACYIGVVTSFLSLYIQTPLLSWIYIAGSRDHLRNPSLTILSLVAPGQQINPFSIITLPCLYACNMDVVTSFLSLYREIETPLLSWNTIWRSLLWPENCVFTLVCNSNLSA